MKRIEKNILLKTVLEKAGKEAFESVKWYIDDNEALEVENVQLRDIVDLLKHKLNMINTESSVTIPKLKSVEEFKADVEAFCKWADEDFKKWSERNDKMGERFDKMDERGRNDVNTGWCIND